MISLSSFLTDPYRSTLVVFALLATAAYAHKIMREESTFLAAFWLVCMWSGIRCGLGTQTILPGDKFELLLIDRSALEGLYWLCLSTFLYAAASAAQLASLVNALVVLNIALLVLPPNYGLLSNPSMSGTFAALCLPLLLTHPVKKVGRVLAALTLILLPFTKASNPLAIAGAEMLAFSFFIPWRRRAMIWAVSAGVAVLATWKMGGLHVLTDGSGRFNLWKEVWQYWATLAPWGLGTGTGSFYGLSHHFIQGGGHTLFPFMHSDWQQVLFEQGVFGILSGSALYGSLLWASRRHAVLFSFWIGWGIACLSNMPVRYVPTAICGLLALKITLAMNREKCPLKTKGKRRA